MPLKHRVKQCQLTLMMFDRKERTSAMKRIILVGAVLAACTFSAQAQHSGHHGGHGAHGSQGAAAKAETAATKAMHEPASRDWRSWGGFVLIADVLAL